MHGLDGLGDDAEAQLRRKSHGTQHPQGVVAVGPVRLERGAEQSGIEVADAAERIHQRPVILFLQAECHRIDRKVAAALILFDRAVLDYGLAGFGAVGLPSRTYELHFIRPVMQHRRAEIAEYGHVGPDLGSDGFGKTDAAAFDHYVDVVAGPLEEIVTHEPAYDEGSHALLAGGLRHYGEYLVVKCVCHCCSICSYVGTLSAKR